MDPDLKDRLDLLLKLATKAEKQEAADYLHDQSYHVWGYQGVLLPIRRGCRCYNRGLTDGPKEVS